MFHYLDTPSIYLTRWFGESTTNIIGQIRIYSLVDLILFAYAIGGTPLQIIGITLIHVSFLFYLEYTHKHSYRLPISKHIWIAIGLLGIACYPSPLAIIGYILGSMLYVRKNRTPFSYFSPFSRGFQHYFLAAGIVGLLHPYALLSFGLLAVRNFVGDLRDTIKDRSENMMTLPVVFWLQKDYKSLHLITLLITTAIWWYISGLSLEWLVGILFIEVVTYNITPR